MPATLCRWQGGGLSGWCALDDALHPCAAYNNNPRGCSTAVNATTGELMCKIQPQCKDACADCSSCIGNMTQLVSTPLKIAVGSNPVNTSSATSAFGAVCYGRNFADAARCDLVMQQLQMPGGSSMALRPGALCYSMGMCTNACKPRDPNLAGMCEGRIS